MNSIPAKTSAVLYNKDVHVCAYMHMHLSTAKRLSFLPGLTQSCCYTNHHNNGDNIKNLCTLYSSCENEIAHAIWHVLRAVISPLKGVIRNMKTESSVIPGGAFLLLTLNSCAWDWRLDSFPVWFLLSSCYTAPFDQTMHSRFLLSVDSRFNFKL